MISASWRDPAAEILFGDQTVFDQLRVDPYYLYTANRRPDAADYIHALLQRSRARRVSLVHGDWSPKNLLVHERQLWVIDWEVIHYGDPSFDAGFLLNHLVMKSLAMPQYHAAMTNLARVFTESLEAAVPADGDWLVPAALEHLPALLLARVEGKSPAEYLDSPMRQRAADLALALMRRPPSSVEEVFSR
jgi:Ser/Thr protein kinase RdoA (MazF antagonist)